jgi:medium-chain acyl-[acyl-carrier-protein] hydrolase
VRLFCFPHAGGGASAFRDWAALAGPGVQVCPVQLPGRESRAREPLVLSLAALAQQAALGLRPYLDMPFAFYGHSFGAVLAFEVARALRGSSSAGPAWLFAGGCPAPARLRAADPPRHTLPHDAFLAEVVRLGGTPQAVLSSSELLDLVAPILRADFAALETYRHEPGPPLACPITVFGGLDDDQVRPDDLEAWREATRAGFEMHVLPGDHFFPRTSLAPLLELLTRALQSLDLGAPRGPQP